MWGQSTLKRWTKVVTELNCSGFLYFMRNGIILTVRLHSESLENTTKKKIQRGIAEMSIE